MVFDARVNTLPVKLSDEETRGELSDSELISELFKWMDKYMPDDGETEMDGVH